VVTDKYLLTGTLARCMHTLISAILALTLALMTAIQFLVTNFIAFML
jgi:hypothetical protein